MTTKAQTHKRYGLRILLVILIVLVAALLALRLYLGNYTYDNSLSGADLAANSGRIGITNIMLFGIDTRNDPTDARSDTMMILTVDSTRGKVKLTSLMRDSRVNIDEHGETKLCHAYKYGGPALAIRTVNQTFGTDIKEYVTVDFAQMKILIDKVGGVYIDVSEAERREANKFITEYTKERGAPDQPIEQAGYQHLNGVQAMIYARIRKGNTGGDWSRVERQSVVLQAMMDQVKTKNNLQLLGLAHEILPNVTTSLSPGDLMPLALRVLGAGRPALEHSRVPAEGEWAYGGEDDAYIVYDTSVAAQEIRDYIYNDVTPGA